MLMAMASLALNTGFTFELRQRMATVADSAALSAAFEVQRGNSANISTYADREVATAVAAGQLPSGVSTIARLCSDGAATCTGAAANNSAYVEVVLSKTQTNVFGGFIGSSLTPRVRAVAGTASSSACLYALATSGVAVSIANNASLNAQNCTIQANSTASNAIDVSNNGEIDAAGGRVGTTGNCSVGNNGSITPTCQASVPPANDPLSELTAPAVGGCVSWTDLSNNQAGTANPGTYCNGIALGNNAKLTMNPGVYVLTGSKGLSLGNNSVVTGTGVMIFNTGTGAVSLSNNATVTMSAPTSGTYNGILIFQAAANTTAFTISNNGTFTLSGALYFPSASVTISNNGAAATDCSLVVAQRLILSNNAAFYPSRTCSAYGGSPLKKTALAE